MERALKKAGQYRFLNDTRHREDDNEEHGAVVDEEDGRLLGERLVLVPVEKAVF